MRDALHGVAAGILLVGLTLAMLLPESVLSVCVGLGFIGCEANPLVMRAVIGGISILASLTVWMIGSTARR